VEVPLWILAISQLLVDILIAVLIVVLITVALLVRKFTKRLGGKADTLLDDARDAVDYVKESKIVSVLKFIFAPSNYKKFKQKRKRKRKEDGDEIISW
jgi:MFS superfamily sulfate permease-like transporter